MFFSRFIVSGQSMEPAFCANDRLMILNSNLFPKKGDVVVLQDPRDGRLILKRIVEMDGDNCFVKGDNEDFSTDSRVFGPVSKKKLIGRALFRY